MATEAQLKALEKARKARKSKPKKTTKKNPIKREKYVIYLTHRNRKFFFTGKDTFDTNVRVAKEYSSKLHASDVVSVLNSFGRDAKIGKKP